MEKVISKIFDLGYTKIGMIWTHMFMLCHFLEYLALIKIKMKDMCLKKNTVCSQFFFLSLQPVLISHFISNTKENLWILNRKTLVERQPFQAHANWSNPILSSTLGTCRPRTVMFHWHCCSYAVKRVRHAHHAEAWTENSE